MDRNVQDDNIGVWAGKSLSARRAWIEMDYLEHIVKTKWVALRKESVDRNAAVSTLLELTSSSLSARRAWIEIL